ncbi:MAG TPA: tetratricopeptide repeat-containing protein [Pyrinomonadaceae bacterium]|nr:tetratricopeptide repeat-containing protein [Pyrinomonadaceae bacterium]
MMRAFIVRPFGTKNDINFDEVERVLIAPALEAVGAKGGTTIDIVESGNIRVDMFRRLLTADLVVADLSIHNANVFYELGIRHALRDHGTFMLRCDADKFPFDLQTDRYFVYSKDNPAASLADLIKALKSMKDAAEKNAAVKDSPVFMSLPGLREPEPSMFNPVPQDFGEEVWRAISVAKSGDLALLSYEVNGFEWETSGWRTVGRAQFDIKSLVGAKETWEAVRKLNKDDLEANIRLGTIYERLGDLALSTQALERALGNPAIKRDERAEAYALMARNSKTRWREEWEAAPPSERAATALQSSKLRDSIENYEHAFNEDLNHFYSGLNALAMLKIMIALAEAMPDVWAGNFKNEGKAAEFLEESKEHAAKLAAAVELSLSATSEGLQRNGKKDMWAEISAADLNFITTEEPQPFVAASYRKALAGAPGFARDSASKQLAIYRDLNILGVNLAEVFKVVGDPPPLAAPGAEPAARPQGKRVLLFAGHMIDAPDRKKPRFPADKEQIAREKIKEAVLKEMNSGAGVKSGYAGGASGGDILFQEVCAELGIPTRLYLAIPPQKYVVTSVQKAGPEWVERFWNLYNEHKAQKQVRELSDATDDSEYLPAWLREKPDYGIWQRNNLWMLFNALDEGCDPKSDDPNLTLIALWDGAGGDGAGGTADLVNKVEGMGARCEIIKTQELFGL